MSNTYTQIYIHAVFGVKNKAALIQDTWEDKLYRYLQSIIKKEGHQPIAVNGMANHIHIFFGLNPNQSLSKCMQLMKGSSSKWINEQGFVKGKFQWQSGYGAFSYSQSQVDVVCSYLANQKEHHKKVGFREEFQNMLERFDIPFDPQYLPEDV